MEKAMAQIMPRISLIIPVYNAEKTLPRSLASIRSQLTQDMEIVFVNDGSTDGSANIISGFLQENGTNGQLIHQVNGGVAVARNTGIDAAKGDYLAFLDADDQFSDGALQTIIRALESQTDILGWDWINEKDGRVREMHQADYQTQRDALNNLMSGTMKWNLWLFSVRRNLVLKKGLRFIPGADMGEDMLFMLMAFASANNVKQLHQALYRYNASNSDSISNVMNERRRREVGRNFEAAALFLASSPYANLSKDLMPHLQLYIKRPLLISFSKKDYLTWYNWFPEANSFSFNNTTLPFRTRLLQWLAAHRLYNAVKIYNIIIYDFLNKLRYH